MIKVRKRVIKHGDKHNIHNIYFERLDNSDDTINVVFTTDKNRAKIFKNVGQVEMWIKEIKKHIKKHEHQWLRAGFIDEYVDDDTFIKDVKGKFK